VKTSPHGPVLLEQKWLFRSLSVYTPSAHPLSVQSISEAEKKNRDSYLSRFLTYLFIIRLPHQESFWIPHGAPPLTPGGAAPVHR